MQPDLGLDLWNLDSRGALSFVGIVSRFRGGIWGTTPIVLELPRRTP